jgi:histidyl-tRNA synthetase
MSLKEIGVAPPKGFRDILPQETAVRDGLIASILQTYRSFGFERVETPIVEDVRRLTHSDGGENLGMLFKILKRGDKLDLASPGLTEDAIADLALRYDLTVPLARYYANHRNDLPSVFKAVQLGPVFRAERPQHGRFRQFYQFDIDILGGTSPGDEVELLSASLAAYAKLGVTNGCMRINDRRILTAMVDYAGIPADGAARALISFDKMDKVGLSGVRDLLIKDGFSEGSVSTFIDVAQKVEALPVSERLAEIARRLEGVLAAEVCSNLTAIISGVKVSEGNTIAFDPFLVRGMGYYTGPVFELVVPEFSGSLGGGGRYDKLIGKLSGVEATACGFSIGFERMVALFADRLLSDSSAQRKVAVFYDDVQQVPAASEVASELRAQGAIASLFISPKNFKAALEKLKGAGYTEFGRIRNGEVFSTKGIG